MSKLKMFEITLEANSFDGSQVFACYAIDEQDAMLKLKRGECDIIESNIEVLGLDKVPIDIMESDDITSRLLIDVNARQHATITKQAEQLKMLRKELKLSTYRLDAVWSNLGSMGAKSQADSNRKALEATKPVEE